MWYIIESMFTFMSVFVCFAKVHMNSFEVKWYNSTKEPTIYPSPLISYFHQVFSLANDSLQYEFISFIKILLTNYRQMSHCLPLSLVTGLLDLTTPIGRQFSIASSRLLTLTRPFKSKSLWILLQHWTILLFTSLFLKIKSSI